MTPLRDIIDLITHVNWPGACVVVVFISAALVVSLSALLVFLALYYD